MAIHPIETRYGRGEVKRIFSEEGKLQKMLEVEVALAKAHAELGNIPKDAAAEIERIAKENKVKLSRIKEIEREINHDVMAFVKAFAEACGDAGKYVHLGATSNDILDTALALQLKDFISFLEEDLLKLKRTLLRIAKEKKTLVCVARTHGQHALPTTYGLKFAIFAAEVHRHIQRLEEIKKRILVGKMSGAVGTQAAFGAKGIEIQKRVMNHLGLKPALVSNQVLQRDRHAEFIFLLALISQTLSKIALEIRNLQRSEIDEVREHFVKEKQVGSSTMPHKRNPIIAERICGLSRVIKASVIPALDNIPLWHERDLTNSSCERIIIPETCILTDYILNLTIKLLENLDFNEEAIRKNLELSKGRIMAEAVMMKLVERGMGRQDAHELVRKIAILSEESNISFKEALLNNREITRYLKPDEIEEILKPENYIGTAVKQVEELIKLIGNEN